MRTRPRPSRSWARIHRRGDLIIDGPPLPTGFTLLQITPRMESGGVERVTLDTAAAVARAGARSLVASLGGRLAADLAGVGAEFVRLPVHSRNPATVAANAGRLARLIRAEGVSLIHVRSRAPAFSALWAGRATGVPVVATYHGVYQARSSLKRWYNSVMTRGDLTIANSLFTRDHVLAEHHLAASRLVVVPEGVDTEAFAPARVAPERIAAMRGAWGLAADDPRPVVLLAARLTGWKGQGLLIEAMGRLRGDQDPWLILAGRPEKPAQAADLEAAARRAGVAARVRLVGAVDDMPAALAAASVVAAPSTLPESFGRSVAEAGSMARMVLASPLGGPAETIVDGETGWLIPAGDVAAWAGAVDAALALTPAARESLGRAARDRIVRLYSLEAMTRATFAAYRRALEIRA